MPLVPPPPDKRMRAAATQIKDVVDVNMVRQGQPGYLNEEIAPGDLILLIDGQNAQGDMLTGAYVFEHAAGCLAGSGERCFCVSLRLGYDLICRRRFAHGGNPHAGAQGHWKGVHCAARAAQAQRVHRREGTSAGGRCCRFFSGRTRAAA